MVETRLDLSQPVEATLDANGRGSARVGPGSPWERWEVTRYAVFTAGSGCAVQVYKNYESPSNWIDGTFASDGDVGGIQSTLNTGESLVFVWSEGIPGETMQAIVYGNRYVRGRRAY